MNTTQLIIAWLFVPPLVVALWLGVAWLVLQMVNEIRGKK